MERFIGGANSTTHWSAVFSSDTVLAYRSKRVAHFDGMPAPVASMDHGGLNAALLAISNGVDKLFRGCPKFAGAHSLCECALLRRPPPTWRSLGRFPVLKRRAALLWKERLEKECGASSGKRRSLQQRKRCIDATTGFCMVLAQCGLLVSSEVELLQLLVDVTYPELLQAVVVQSTTRVRGNNAMLPLRIRLLLASLAVERHCQGEVGTDAVQWIEQVASKLADELMEAIAQSTTTSTIPVKKSKRVCNDGDTSTESKVCNFCNYERREGDVNANARYDGADGWASIYECIQRSVNALRRLRGGVDCEKASDALVILRNVISTAGFQVCSTTRDVPVNGNHRHLFSSNSIEITTAASCLNISVQAYRQICSEILHVSGGDNQADASQPVRDSEHSRFDTLWQQVWSHELRHRRKPTDISLPEVIQHCARVDRFVMTAAAGATSFSGSSTGFSTQLLGFQVVRRVVAAVGGTNVEAAIPAFARVCGCDEKFQGGFPGKMVSSTAVSTGSKRLSLCYLQELLMHAYTSASSPQRTTVNNHTITRDRGAIVRSLLSFAPTHTGLGTSFRWTSLWDAVLIHCGKHCCQSDCPSVGVCWLSAVLDCVRIASELDGFASGPAIGSLQDYCAVLFHGILVSGGAVISSGGSLEAQLIRTEQDRVFVQQALTKLIETFGMEWTSRFVVKVLRSSARLRLKATDSELRVGLQMLLFPVIAGLSGLKSRSQRLEEHETRRNYFVDMMPKVKESLQENTMNDEYVSVLVEFCCNWNQFHSRQIPENASSLESNSGTRALMSMNMYREIIVRFSNQKVLRRESVSVLQFLARTLQGATNCPSTLGEQVFELITQLTAAIESASSPPAAKSSLSNAAASLRPQLISHSSEVFQVVFQASTMPDSAQMGVVTRQLEESGQLETLIQQIKRWVYLMEADGDRSISLEGRAQFAVLCNRLVYWLPEQCREISLLLTPIDTHLVHAVKIFAKQSSSFHHDVDTLKSTPAMGTPQRPSQVRVEMAVRSYLRSASLPDLCRMTALFFDSILMCDEHSVRDELAKIALRNTDTFIAESMISTFEKALKSLQGIESNLVTADNDEAVARREVVDAKRVIRCKNALELLGNSTGLLGVAVPWSASLFDAASVDIWLPYLLDFALGTRASSRSNCCESLLVNLEMLLHDEDRVVGTFRSSFFLAGLLSTICFLLTHLPRTGSDSELVAINHLQRVSLSMSKALRLTMETGSESEQNTASLLVASRRLARFHKGSVRDDNLLCHEIGGENVWNAVDHRVWRLYSDSDGEYSTPIVLLSFSRWLNGALVFSQALSATGDPDRIAGNTKLWERVFADYVHGLYLPIEFNSCARTLSRSWLLTWISSNLSRAEAGEAFLSLQPFQIALYHRLVRMQPGRTKRDTVCSHLFDCLKTAMIMASDGSEEKINHSLDVATRCIEILRIVDLAATVDFFNGSSSSSIVLNGINELVTQMSALKLPFSSSVKVLQFPLELVVYFYVCQLNAKHQLESEHFVETLRKHLCTLSVPSSGTRHTSQNGTDRCTKSIVAWKSDMLLKYGYLHPERCQDIVRVVENAFAGEISEDTDDQLSLEW